MKAVRTVLFAVLMNVLCCLTAWGQAALAEQATLRQSFEAEYEAWKKDCALVSYSSLTSDRLKSEHFKNIVAMGPAALPYLVEKRLQDPNFTWAGSAWGYIARVSTSPSVSRWAKEPITAWWQGGKRQAIERFDLLNNERKKLKARGLSTEEAVVRKSIRALGIAALPLIVDQLRAGDADLIETIQQITEGASKIVGVTTEERIASCLAWWQDNKEKWLIPFPNKRPVANAGQDQRVPSGAIVSLDASLSTDDDKDVLTFHWRQVSGPSVELSDARATHPTFTAPKVQEETIMVFELMVNDGSPKHEVHPSCESGDSKPAKVTVTVDPKN
jgi:hypothetical protein